VRFHKPRRTITFECWAYSADVTQPGTQMDTWPVTVTQLDNYARAPAAFLPTLKISGAKNPVVQVYEERSGELVYALRVNGDTFRPHVFAPGAYTVKVGDQDAGRMKTLPGLAARTDQTETLTITV
ncbi:MAG: hypothetical protein RLZZ15_1012, partial [Verrucomicrobiota bacterium]